MKVELQINNTPDPRARYVAWAPAPCRVRVSDPAGVTTATVNIRIGAKLTAGGGDVSFRRGTTGAFSKSITVAVPANGASVPFFTAGKFGSPSLTDGDVTVEASHGATVVGSVPVMVRVRKNANTLTAGERDRFIAAFAQLNNQGAGRFQDFRDMHMTQASLNQAHRNAGFLPWHRAYLLDLERELQAVDPSVALHYWRFDQPAPNLFSRDFLGVPDTVGTVEFSASNPLRFWVTDGVPGINRRPFFDTNVEAADVIDEAATLALGSTFKQFRTMEGNPHGFAHTSFGGMLQSPSTAPRDPLFFLLHCNVDRLWAKWQQKFGRFDPDVASSFDSAATNPKGHNLPDTMWPWDGDTVPPRPTTAPGGSLATSPCVSAPGNQPRVRDCIDYRGSIAATAAMGFDYDDTPFA